MRSTRSRRQPHARGVGAGDVALSRRGARGVSLRNERDLPARGRRGRRPSRTAAGLRVSQPPPSSLLTLLSSNKAPTKMLPETGQRGAGRTPGLLLSLQLLLLLPSSAVMGENTERPTFSATGGLHSVMEDTVSPAFSATVIIIVTVIISGSAYLCFLKYICTGCCKSTQVVPDRRLDPSRSEEQV